MKRSNNWVHLDQEYCFDFDGSRTNIWWRINPLRLVYFCFKWDRNRVEIYFGLGNNDGRNIGSSIECCYRPYEL